MDWIKYGASKSHRMGALRGTQDADCRLIFFGLNRYWFFFFFNYWLPTLKHQAIWYKYSDFCLSSKDQIWRHWTFIATLQQLAGSENRLSVSWLSGLLWVLLIQISLFTRWISNACSFLAPLWLSPLGPSVCLSLWKFQAGSRRQDLEVPFVGS